MGIPASINPVERIEAAARRAEEKRAVAERAREEQREQNRAKFPDIYALLDEGRELGLRVKTLTDMEAGHHMGKEFDDRVQCRDCKRFGKLTRQVNHDGRKRKSEIPGCRLFDSGKEPYRLRRCKEFMGRNK